MRPVTPPRSAVVTAALAAVALLAGCGAGGGGSSAGNPPATAQLTQTATPAVVSLSVIDAWVKAVPTVGKMDMTGVFGKIANTGSTPVTIVSATNSVSPVTELHETVTNNGTTAMRPVSGGFTIAPGQTRELQPGGDHIMIMKLTKPIAVGDPVTVTLTTNQGGNVQVTAVAKPFTGAQEPYQTGTASPMGPSATMGPTMTAPIPTSPAG